MRIVIVGNGPAALSAVEAIREKDGTSDISIVSGEACGPYTPCFLGKFVAGTAGAGQLALKPDDYYERYGVELLTGRAATKVLPEKHEVVLEDGTAIGYDRLLLAMGAAPVIPDIPGLSGEGVFYFKSLSDAEAIRKRAGRGCNAVVLGSGFVGAEIAEALSEAGCAVTLVARRDRILRRIFDAEVAGMVEAHMSAHGVRFAKRVELVDVERDSATGDLRAAVLSDGVRLPCDLLVVGVGMRPNVGILAGSSIAVGEGVLTDDAMRTSVPDVFAAGDVAEAEIAGLRKVNLIHPNAVASGAVAGAGMVGVQAHMSAHLPDMNVLTVFDRSFLAVGALEGAAVLRQATLPGSLVKVFVDERGLIKGVELVGDVTRGGLYGSLIARGVRADAVPDLLAPSFNYGVTSGMAACAS